jgi:hypothetical protein
MRQPLHAVAAVALVVLAGCSGVPTSGPDVPTTESPVYPPGVTEDGLDDWRALLDAHSESVRDHGAVVTSNTTVEAPVNGEVRTVELNAEGRAAPDAGPVYFESERLRVAGNDSTTREQVAGYADHEAVTRRDVVDGNASVARESRDRVAALRDRHVVRERQLQRVLSAGSFSVASVEQRDGRWVTTLVANEAELTDDGDDHRSEFSATIEVAASGRMLSLTFTRDPYADQRLGREDARITWTSGMPVETPEWAR